VRAAARCFALQRGDLAAAEITKLARADVFVVDRADPHPLQPNHRMADGFAHPAHLPVPPFVNHQRQQRAIAA
jgi:hypothetical protein